MSSRLYPNVIYVKSSFTKLKYSALLAIKSAVSTTQVISIIEPILNGTSTLLYPSIYLIVAYMR